MTEVGPVDGFSAVGTVSAQSSQSNRDVLGQDAFLKLLVKQLEYQDPLSPMQDREFIVQMAQLQTLEQMAQLNEKQAAATEILQGIRELLGESGPPSMPLLPLVSTLVGREVSWLEGGKAMVGWVQSVLKRDEEWLLQVDGGNEVPMAAVTQVR